LTRTERKKTPFTEANQTRISRINQVQLFLFAPFVLIRGIRANCKTLAQRAFSLSGFYLDVKKHNSLYYKGLSIFKRNQTQPNATKRDEMQRKATKSDEKVSELATKDTKDTKKRDFSKSSKVQVPRSKYQVPSEKRGSS